MAPKPVGAKLHVARRRVESKLNKVVISKTKILRSRRWKVINSLAEFYYSYGRIYLKQPSYREDLIAWDFSKCAKKFALNHITINDNGGFNRHRHVGEEGETKGRQAANKLRRISRSAFEAFLRYSFVARTGVWQLALQSLRRSREKARDSVARGRELRAERWAQTERTREANSLAPLSFPSGAGKRGEFASRRRGIVERTGAPDSKDEKGRGGGSRISKSDGGKM